METYSGKRSAGRVITPRKGYGVNLKDRANDGDQHAKFCNRIGCSGRIKYNQDSTIGTSNKAKCTKPSSFAENRKEIIKNPSSEKKSSINPKSSYAKRDSPESSISIKSEVSETGSSSASSTDKSRKVFHHKSGSFNQNGPPTYPVSTVPKSSSRGACSSGLRNLKCNSISDVVPRSCPSSEPKSSKKMNGGASLNGRFSRSTNGISICDSRRGGGGWTPREDVSGASSVRTQRSNNGNTRTRLSNRRNGNISSLEPPADIISRFSRPETPGNVDGHGSSPRFSTSGQSSYSLSSNNGDTLSSLMPSSSTGFGTTRLMNHNMDGVAEILLALERIRHEEPLTHEQLLEFETSLIISGLNLYDQHRGMRLDIDNMSYEELLALEECMGTVSTAVSEEQLSKCLGRSIYHGSLSHERVLGSNEDGDDIKCSICQDEYELGDEIGKLVECQHGYHVACIQQWLRLKNWCPICKASAVPS